MKNHWLKKRENKPNFSSPEWQQITVICDASGIQFYLDGNLSDVQYFRYSMNEAVIKEIMAEEEAKFWDAMEAACSEEYVVQPEIDW